MSRSRFFTRKVPNAKKKSGNATTYLLVGIVKLFSIQDSDVATKNNEHIKWEHSINLYTVNSPFETFYDFSLNHLHFYIS